MQGANGPRAGTRWVAPVGRMVAVGGVYLLSAHIGFHLAYANRFVTAVWPPTGVSLAALLLWGPEVTPGIAAGALLANLTRGAGWEASLLITVGNTLAPLTGWFLVTKVARVGRRLDRFPDVVGVLLLGGPLSMGVSATLGTASLGVTGGVAWSAYGSTWLTWWVGDAMGVLMTAPVLLVLATDWYRDVVFDGWRVAEAVVVGGAIAGISWADFVHRVPIAYVLFPLTAWAAVRLGRMGAVGVLLIISGISVYETVNGFGPFAVSSPTRSLVELQVFNGALCLTILVLAAVALEARRAGAELRIHAAGLEEILRIERLAAFGEMTSVVSHELRNPLAAVTNAAYLLRNRLGTDVDETVDRYLAMIERSASRASNLAEELLTYRRVRAPQRQELDVAQLVAEALELAPPPPGVDVRVDVTGLRVTADPGQMAQILANIITNAYQAMPDGGLLELTGEDGEHATVLYVADNGSGFDPAISGRMFEPFFTTKGAGSGLGLAIVRQLAEAHGGSISIDNRPGGGAVVTVRLP